jgi:hypothetical protein
MRLVNSSESWAYQQPYLLSLVASDLAQDHRPLVSTRALLLTTAIALSSRTTLSPAGEM